ncbi:hypothetical protein GJ496_000455 [Pomphorhynchus laevis]|nr:hypothetical protein GJ496_000455 [Pomphorhynchus laevis]
MYTSISKDDDLDELIKNKYSMMGSIVVDDTITEDMFNLFITRFKENRGRKVRGIWSTVRPHRKDNHKLKVEIANAKHRQQECQRNTKITYEFPYSANYNWELSAIQAKHFKNVQFDIRPASSSSSSCGGISDDSKPFSDHDTSSFLNSTFNDETRQNVCDTLNSSSINNSLLICPYTNSCSIENDADVSGNLADDKNEITLSYDEIREQMANCDISRSLRELADRCCKYLSQIQTSPS